MHTSCEVTDWACLELAVRIPGLGFRIEVFKYWDGQPLRFVLKNVRSGAVYGVVQIELRDETVAGGGGGGGAESEGEAGVDV